MNIGLIAMSGIRVQDEELLRLGLTLPGFVERSKTIASLPSLGLLTLAAATPAGHEVSYVEVDELDDNSVGQDGFDLVGISTFTARVQDAYRLADRYRLAGTRVVMGGLHVTALPQEALRHCDAVVIGEGEPCWPELVADAETGHLKRIYDGRARNFDLATSPVPRFDLLDIDRYNRLTVQTSRGCPHRCEFCASSVLLTPVYKQKPVENVLAEIEEILSIWPRPLIEFADDNAVVNKKYWKQLLPHLLGMNVRWFAETDLSVGRDDGLLDLMRRSGCSEVLIGFESPEPGALEGLETRNDWKKQHFAEYREAIQRIQEHGIAVNGCFIIGLDGQTEAVFDEIAAFVDDTGLYDVQVTLQTAFPGTPLYYRLSSAGRLLYPTDWSKCTLFDLNFVPEGMTMDELTGGFRDLVVRLYSDEFTKRRRRHFRQIATSSTYEGEVA